MPRADIVEIKHILLPSEEKRFKDIFVVFELMETDLHQVRHSPIGFAQISRSWRPTCTRCATRRLVLPECPGFELTETDLHQVRPIGNT